MRKDLKNTTESVRRRHIWQPFSVRIDKVQIDVGRRIQRVSTIEADTESYFVSGLHKWSELNLTTSFTTFLHEIDRKCKSLAQIVHHQGEIFGSLIDAISKGEETSLDALLDLLIQLLRDLQNDFEQYVPRTMDALIPLTKHSSVEVVESTFTTFAYLFKYLYRPLSANPIPVFDSFAVLLGRDLSQKPYVVRFAAESLSFLLRRTKAQAQRHFLEHVLQDVKAYKSGAYVEGISYLLAETIKGVDHTLHAKGLTLFETLLDVLCKKLDEVEPGPSLTVLEYMTINLLHHCTRESYRPVLSLYTACLRDAKWSVQDLGWQMCFLSCAVRKGTRIEDWTALAKSLSQSLVGDVKESRWNAARLASVILTYAPHNSILSSTLDVVEALAQGSDGHHTLLAFSEVVAKQNLDNFVMFVLPVYRKFINNEWNNESMESIMRSVLDLSAMSAFSKNSSAVSEGKLRVSPNVCETVMTKIHITQPDLKNQAYIMTLIRFLGAVTCGTQVTQSLCLVIERCIEARQQALATRKFATLIGACLELFAISGVPVPVRVVANLSTHSGLWTSAAFLRGFSSVAIRQGSSAIDADTIFNLLEKNLSAPDHGRRLSSLQIVQSLSLNFGEFERDLLSVCEIIEATDLTLDATRSLAMQIRKLNQNYPTLRHAETKRVIGRFMMGLLTTNYTPFWGFASETLSIIAQTDPDFVWNLAKEWFDNDSFLIGSAEQCIETVREDLTVSEAKLDCFRCFNTAELRQNCVDVIYRIRRPEETAKEIYETDTKQEDNNERVSRRSQAIRVFSAVSALAEKHSRSLVPVFLTQLGDLDDDDEEDVDEADPVRGEEDDTPMTEFEDFKLKKVDEECSSTSRRFNKKERNDLLTLFSKFSNPAACYQAIQLRQVVLELLASRDSRTQNLAFQILLNFRDQNLKRYEDNLRNLLSDTRSRDEITTFLQADSNDTQIQEEHRSHVMPIVARILYGRMISRRHAGSQKKGLSNTRNVILGAVASMRSEDVSEFVYLFLRIFQGIKVIDKEGTSYAVMTEIQTNGPSLRKQIGFCTMIQDSLEQLAGKMQPFIEQILDALIYCFISASGLLKNTPDTEETRTSNKVAKNIQTSVYRSLEMLFRYCRTYNWRPYMHLMYAHFITPRLEKLPQESSQNPSGLLKLFSNWASSPLTSPFLVEYNDQVLGKIFECLAESSLKDAVAIFILNMVQDLADQVITPGIIASEDIRKALLEDKVELFLDNMTKLLEHQHVSSTNNTINSDFLDLEISVLSAISPLVSGGLAVQKLLDLLMPLLIKPRKLVPELVKENILRIVENFLPVSEDYIAGGETLWKKYNAITSLFGSCASRSSRESLGNIMCIFADKDKDVAVATKLITQLNAFSKRRLDTPDFDTRLSAFAALNEQEYTVFGIRAWRAIIYNMIFFIGDEEELAIRTNATYTVRRLFETCRDGDEARRERLTRILETDLLPAIKKGVRHRNELIRQEWVGLLGNMVKDCSFWPHISDMVPLLVGNDEEANFFYNILHIQQHRRMRALRRLVTISHNNEIQSNNIAQIILPLIEHYCFSPNPESHNLIAETIKSIGQLARSMKFNQYSALLKRYIGMLKPSETTQATVVRLIGSVVQALVGNVDVATDLVDYLHDDDDAQVDTNSNALATEDSNPVRAGVPIAGFKSSLERSLPPMEKLHQMISNSFLPALTKYLHSKDEETVSLRIPVAVTVVKLLAALPHEALTMKLPGVLTDVCHILRSRSQDVRDMTRKTLGAISTILGPKYFSFMLAELTGALQRGYQLHVLGFSIHTILVKLEPEYGSLDYCLPQIINMLIDDIFGETGVEKEAEEYISKMKEMKTTKSFDSFEILASCTKLSSLGEILWPLKTLLAETSSLKVIRKVDEVCRRLTLGILRNEQCSTRDSLLFCYNVYQQTMSSTLTQENKVLSIQEQARKDAEKNFVVDLKARKSYVRDHFKANAHKLLKFSLETLRAILQKNPSLQTPENLAAFIPMIGDSMMSGYEDVHISALRLLTQIIRVDLRTIDTSAPVFLDQAVGFIRSSASTNSEICQASLKFISTILKERKSVEIRDSVLAYLLIRIKADIEEPDRQGVTFSILRSIMSRKLMVPELYDLMDDVGTMMVTNQSSGPRDTARVAYYQFLMDYPQGKGRFKKQISFLVKNLEYVHASGRKSVMEVLSLIITQFDISILQEHFSVIFLALILALVNDEEADCREMAGTLIKKVMVRAEKEHHNLILNALKSWAYNEQDLLQRASLQGFGLLFEATEVRKDDSQFFLEKLQDVVKSVQTPQNEGEAVATEVVDLKWQVLYYGLQTFSKLVTNMPKQYICVRYAGLWNDIQQLMLYQHAWIRLSCSRLIGQLFANRVVTEQVVLQAGKDLTLEVIDLVRIARHLLIQLRSPFLSPDLGTQITKNLIFLLRFFADKCVSLPPREDDAEEDHQAKDHDLEMDEQVSCVRWLLKRVATFLQSDRDVRRETHMLVRRLLLQFFAAAIQSLETDQVLENAAIMAKPLYKYSDTPANNPEQTSVKDLATEIFGMLQKKIGQTKYAEVYNQVRQAQLAIRQARKQKRTIENVRFPERGAMKKVKASLKKRERRADLSNQHKRKRELGV